MDERQPPDRTPEPGDWSQLLPAPTGSFRHRAWQQFERALDPLARPRPLPIRREPR